MNEKIADKKAALALLYSLGKGSLSKLVRLSVSWPSQVCRWTAKEGLPLPELPSIVLPLARSLIIACCLPLFAQDAGAVRSASAQRVADRFPGQWVGDLFAVGNRLSMGGVYLVCEDNVIREAIPALNETEEFPVPREVRGGTASVGWHGSSLYALAYPFLVALEDPDGTRFTSFTFAKWQDGEWQHCSLTQGVQREAVRKSHTL